MRCADDSECPRKRTDLAFHDLSSAHINELHVSRVINHDILWLEISVDDAIRVQILNREEERCDVELRVHRREQTDLTYDIEQLHPFNEL